MVPGNKYLAIAYCVYGDIWYCVITAHDILLTCTLMDNETCNIVIDCEMWCCLVFSNRDYYIVPSYNFFLLNRTD